MPPNHLAVYLSNRCNLQCRYCYVAVNQGEAAYLDFEAIRRNVDYFLETVPGPDRKFTFLGGEPLLNFGLLQRAVEYVRLKAGPDAVLQTFTNGTSLTKERLAWLEERRVFVTLSLDGAKEVNDANRVFARGSDRSVFDEVLSKLEDLPKSSLGVSLVFDSTSVGSLLRNIDLFYRMGFSRITFNPQLYELWPEDKLRELELVMDGFRRYYKAILAGGSRPFSVPILFSVLETERSGASWWHECHNVVLGPDGSFYSCDKALSFTLDRVRDGRAGDAAAGMDWGKRAEELASARREVEEAVGGKEQHFCPMGVVFYSKYAGVPAKPLVENFTQVSGIFGGALRRLVEELRPLPAFRALYQDVQLV
jgi:sulfatase maturation enzyme AslB (radical SAM superfamily)